MTGSKRLSGKPFADQPPQYGDVFHVRGAAKRSQTIFAPKSCSKSPARHVSASAPGA